MLFALFIGEHSASIIQIIVLSSNDYKPHEKANVPPGIVWYISSVPPHSGHK